MPKLTRANCIMCMLRPVTYAGFLGTSPIELSCRHCDGNKPNATVARYSRFWGSLCAFVTAAEVIGLLLRIIKQVHYKEKFDFVQDVFWYITYSRVIHITFLGNVMSPFKIKELNGLVSILTKRNWFGIQTFFSTPTVMFYRNISAFTLMIIISSQITYFIVIILNNNSLYDVIENLSSVLCIVVHAVTAFNFILTGFVYAHFYSVCFSRIKECLAARITERKSVNVVKLPREATWTDELIKLTRLYSCLQKNFMLGKDYSAGIAVMSFIMFTVMFVFNFFLLTLRLLYQTEMNFLALVLQIETVASLFFLTGYCLVYEHLANLNEDITSFLFRYPISKLSQAEAAQVEMMITTLYVQKPVLKASDIFTVGTKLLASISGTVVTYVLVALQFHASWVKD